MGRLQIPARIAKETAREMRQNLIDIIVNVHCGMALNEVDALALLNAVGVSDGDADELLTAARECGGEE